MANPQLENGYVRIANKVYEALCRSNLPGRHLRVSLAIIRKTWGWKKKRAKITFRDFAGLTGIRYAATISQITNDLVRLNMLLKTSTWGKPCEYEFNKNWESWLPYISVEANSSADANISVEAQTNISPGAKSSTSVEANGGLARKLTPLSDLSTDNITDKVQTSTCPASPPDVPSNNKKPETPLTLKALDEVFAMACSPVTSEKFRELVPDFSDELVAGGLLILGGRRDNGEDAPLTPKYLRAMIEGMLADGEEAELLDWADDLIPDPRSEVRTRPSGDQLVHRCCEIKRQYIREGMVSLEAEHKAMTEVFGRVLTTEEWSRL